MYVHQEDDMKLTIDSSRHLVIQQNKAPKNLPLLD